MDWIDLRGVEAGGRVDEGRKEASGGTVDAGGDCEEEKKIGWGAPGVTVGVVRGFMRGGCLDEPEPPRPAAAALEESCRSTSRMGVATPQV